MGMFDYLRCDVPLPSGVRSEDQWQTKDGPCEMGLVVISASGRLLFEDAHHEDVPEAERPYFGKPEWDGPSGIFQLCGSLRRVVDRIYDAEFHGDVRFYRIDGDDKWHEYRARFTNGQLQEIVPVESR